MIAVLVGALSTSSSTGFHWLHEIYIFFHILQYTHFSSCFWKIAVLVGVLSSSSSTSFHWLHEIYNFSHILQYSQVSQKSIFLSGPSQPLLLQVFTDSTKFAIFRKFYNIRNVWSFRKNRSSCWGPLKPFFNRFSLTRRVFQFFPHFKIFAIFADFVKIAYLFGAL